jgi:hypothetical protein
VRILFKATSGLVAGIRADLRRSHAFAAERVGFVACRFGRLRRGLVILAHDYHAVADEDYLDKPGFGALMGSGAIRKALGHTYRVPVGMFHVHLHDHRGVPQFSSIDDRETRKFVPDFFNARSTVPHGAIVLSADAACGFAWLPRSRSPVSITEFSFVGAPMVRVAAP